MNLISVTPDHITKMMSWFEDRGSCLAWAGPQFRFPFSRATFVEDARIETLPSYALVGATNDLLGFGQYYLRAGRCHLARLAVAPPYRGQRIGSWLVGGLVQLGAKELSAAECSLFVLADNSSAIRLYERLGFARDSYSGEDFDLAGVEYMCASSERFKRWELTAANDGVNR